jgi:dCTP deaminase
MVGYSSSRRAKQMLVDYQIADRVRISQMIVPFVPNEESNGRVSYGLTSVGYDARLGRGFYVATKAEGLNAVSPATHEGKFEGTAYDRKLIKLPPQTMCLCHTQEYFKIPNNICATVLGKSTWARLGLKLEATPLEPGWEGQITLELFNAGFAPIELREGDGICQVQFHTIDSPRRSYEQKKGRYQFQTGVTFAIRAKETQNDSNS